MMNFNITFAAAAVAITAWIGIAYADYSQRTPVEFYNGH